MRVLKRAREKIGEGGMEEGQKERVRREASVKERGKKARKKRDDVLPGPRATYGALAARLLITRPSRSLFSLSFPFLFPSFSFGSIAFSPDGESFVPRCGLFTLNSAESLGYCLASAAEKVQRRFERKDERKRGVEN